MHADNKNSAFLEAALLVLFGFLWSIPYALNKVSLATIPPMTGPFGCALMGESLTWTTATVLLAVLLGVAAINHRQSSRTPSWFASKFALRAVRAL